MKLIFASASCVLLLLLACTTQQVQTAEQIAQSSVAAVQIACRDALNAAAIAEQSVKGGAASTATSIAGYVTAGCATGAAISTLAQDASSLAWLAKNQGALEGLTVAQRTGVE